MGLANIAATSTLLKQLSEVNKTAAGFFSHPTWDVMLILALFAIAFFSSFRAGKRGVSSRLIATYIALAIYPALPLDAWSKSLNITNNFAAKAVGFLILFTILTLFLGHRGGRGRAPAKVWWKIFVLSVLQVGLLIHLILGFLPQDKIKLLAPLTRNLFANSNLHIWWLLVPFIFMVLLRRWGTQYEE